MKKNLIAALACGAMIVGTAAAAMPAAAFAAEGTGEVNVGYMDSMIPDPDNPTNPDWSVSIPKDFLFVKDTHETHDMTVTLNDIKNGGLAADKKVAVDVASANAYTLQNDTADITSLDYTLTYGTVENTDGQIGELSQDAKTIAGEATIEHDQLSQVGVDGVYTDVLTYTVHSAVDK